MKVVFLLLVGEKLSIQPLDTCHYSQWIKGGLRVRSYFPSSPCFLAMCLFAYPAPRPKKNRKARKPATTTKTTSDDYIQEEWIQSYPAMPLNPGAAGSSYPYWYYYPHGTEQWLEEDRPAYITKGQWASHGETLKGSLDAAHANGQKIGDTRASLSGGIKDTHDAIKDTQAAVKDVHDTLKETYDAIKKNHGEYSSKQDGHAAEIDKVRKHLEDEAKQREEAYQRQQDMQDVWYYSQFLRQAERDAEAGSTRSHSSSKSSSSDRPHRRHARFEEPYEAERRRYHAFAQAPPPPWAGLDPWQHPYPFPSGQDDYRYGHAAAGGYGQRGPPRQPSHPFRHHRRFM
ncbi:hypothetical protein F4820DRAFT_412328 [Hypoxylon rubiginosum]|uniref:Uncharacterized protein n=1 Tax=Hypoxylon rubiginosum TaxID=110542 RepID=A0ACB9ZA29_9PEZI|nr:hypothetical protein F4820DRAFT_412328 [Hypoxylon rubiginosum]